jgi:single-strand DNA-binding protein
MVQLFGHITKDATIPELKDERKVCNFSIALNDSYKPKGREVINQVTFVNCAYWIKPENAAFLTKGKLIEVNARLSVSAYIDLQGDAKGSLNFHVNNFKLYGGGITGNDSSTPGKKAGEMIGGGQITEPSDNLPF